MPKDVREVFYSIVENESFAKGDLCQLLDLQREAELSLLYDLSSIQDSFRFRSQRRAFLLSNFLIEESGEVSFEKVDYTLDLLERKGHIIYPEGFNDASLLEHAISVLIKLQKDQKFWKTLKKFRMPLCHLLAEQFVKDSLMDFTEGKTLSDADVRRCVLSACLSNLRQNVGSCFATAPAILIQKEQLESLLEDLYELLMTGKMKRTFAGMELSVPLSPSSGGGDLYKNCKEDLIYFSPSLMTAFQCVGILPKRQSVKENIEDLRKLLFPFFQKKEEVPLKVFDLIHQVLLAHFSLKEDDLIAYRIADRSFLKSNEFISGIRKDPLSQKKKLCEEFFLKERKVVNCFKSCVDHSLLKVWEFTLASFSELKMEFTRWNFYSSLGLNHEEKGGIGEVIYTALQKEMEENFQKVEEYDREYAIAHDQLRGTESLLQNASTESDIRRLKAEFSSRLYHMRVCQELRDESYKKSTEYSSFYSFLFKEYETVFPEYFQEIYDAEMQDVKSTQYEDSPAGFRLVYKHGRSNASLWSMIYDEEQYVDALVDFFLKIEPHISSVSSWSEAAKVNERLTTLIVSHLRTQEFLETALQRMSKAHGEIDAAGKQLEKREKKPWAYTSGGSMATLLKTYYRRESEVTEEVKRIETPTELLIFILDVLKAMPLALAEDYAEKKRGILISSPSHAFILYPSWDLLKKGWQEDVFTYTWVRDEFILPRKNFYKSMVLSELEQSFLLEELTKSFPPELSFRLNNIRPHRTITVKEFREEVLSALKPFLAIEQVDSFLYETTPLVSCSEWKRLVPRLLGDLYNEEVQIVLESFKMSETGIMSSKKLIEIAKAIYLRSQNSYCFSFDLHKYIALKAEEIGLLVQAPLFFADTNWTHYYFGFVVNPGTLELELWRLDSTGHRGFPMSSWSQWLNGENPSYWRIYCRPFEYTFS